MVQDEEPLGVCGDVWMTGKGKIKRRNAGKQHLLAKKNTGRKLRRLSKMQQVDRSDYDNVIGALPYLKVNQNAT